MRRVSPVAALLLLVGPASAEIILFWSTTGIDSADLMYSTALTNFLPYFVPPTPVAELPAGAYDLFLWGRFVESECFVPPCTMYGLDLMFAGNAGVGQNAAYRHYKPPPGSYKRWDGSHGIPLNGVMVAVTARGIEFIVPPDDNNDLYYPGTQEFLVGAARATGPPGQTLIMALDDDSPLEGLGMVISCQDQPCGPNTPDPPVFPAVVVFFALGDVSGDNLVTFDDINPFVFAFSHSEEEFRVQYPAGHYRAADCNLDGAVDFDDIDPFVGLLSGG